MKGENFSKKEMRKFPRINRLLNKLMKNNLGFKASEILTSNSNNDTDYYLFGGCYIPGLLLFFYFFPNHVR